MKRLLILSSIFDLVIFQCFCFNIDTESPIIYEDQSKYLKKVEKSTKSSYFGFSVILYPGDKPWIQIGAPRSNSPSVNYENPGIIFRCPIGGVCRSLEVDKENGRNKQLHYNNNLNDAWLGAVMDTNLRSNRSVVCASRWKNVVGSASNPDYRMQGACYWSHANSSQFHKKLPLLGDKDLYISTTSSFRAYNYGQGESGFAAHITETGNEMLIGAPGVFNWKGTVMLFTDTPDARNPIESIADVNYMDKNKTPRKRADRDIFHVVNIVDAVKSTNVLAYSLFGYAVTSGNFFSKTLLYVGGAPRSSNYLGHVFIFTFDEQLNQRLNVKHSRKGTQFGEYFGASVAAGDINNDGFDDLFVGAPFHRSSEYNEGRMYLFLGSNEGILKNPPDGHIIDGNEPNGLFGTAITYLGRMNQDFNSTDDYRYVAVAAPYESSGVVYIYRGTVYGLDTRPVQKISGSSIHSNLKGFGISISKPADIDGNGYDDIAIGAYQSGHVVLLRSSPLVKLKTYFKYRPYTISFNFTSFNVTICHKYDSFKGKNSIQLHREIQVDEEWNRVDVETIRKGVEIKNITRAIPLCENIVISRNSRSTLNNTSPIIVTVTNWVEETKTSGKLVINDTVNGQDNFCKDCGMNDDLESQKPLMAVIPISLGCKNGTCISELEFVSIFKGDNVSENTLILGATDVIILDTVVRNKGENAYLLKAQVDLPGGLNLKKKPSFCKQNNRRINCLISNRLDGNKTENLTLSLDMDLKNSNFEKKYLDVNVTISTSSFNKNRNFTSVRLYLITEADIAITGKSAELSYPLGNSIDKKVPFQQIYQIEKYKSSPVYKMRFNVRIPYAIKTKSGNVVFVSLYQPKESPETQSLMFRSDIPYIRENDTASAEGSDAEKVELTRKRRDVDLSQKEMSMGKDPPVTRNETNVYEERIASYLRGNNTFEINCYMTNIICGNVYGEAGPFEKQTAAVFSLNMVLDFQKLSDHTTISKDTIIRYSTEGAVESVKPPNLIQSGNRPDNVIVSSIFLNDKEKGKIALWIIIVSIASGLLLLQFIIIGLIKAGFFRRTKKKELEELKAKAEAEKEEETVAETLEDNASS